ncbi:pyrroline-5-carboxylate reductase [Anaeramoeba flamelloides]|uniref:Pyrroline-5-carboxylate reductase n=1 Tax=Anaeramoeba flamelloides TaxID=1746091 RepID=A0AAV7YX30_9EUKA|nr:pyrroline-5-carboxylate reductase [Anaeramoeba flamelloides]
MKRKNFIYGLLSGLGIAGTALTIRHLLSSSNNANKNEKENEKENKRMIKTTTTTTKYPNLKISFLGGGDISWAIITGLVKNQLIKEENIQIYDPTNKPPKILKEIKVVEEVTGAVNFSDIVVLGIPPHNCSKTLKILNQTRDVSSKIFVSFIKNRTFKYLKNFIGNDSKIIRASFNEPLLINKGASGIVGCQNCIEDDIELIIELLQPVSFVIDSEDESFLDSVDVISGCGTTFVFKLMEALIEEAKQVGIEEEDATNLVIETIIGSGKLSKERNKIGIFPDQLSELASKKNKLDSYALNYLKENSYKSTIVNAIKLSHQKSIELNDK